MPRSFLFPRPRALRSAIAASFVVALALAVAACASTRGADQVPVDVLRSVPKVHLRPPVEDAGSAIAVPEPPSVRALSWGVFGEGDRISELQGALVGGVTLLAWVTYVDPGAPVAPSLQKSAKAPARAGAEPRTASLFVRAVDSEGESIGAPKMVSSKAVALGGVSLAASTGHDLLTLGWTGQEAGRAQVFLTQVDHTGQKIAQRMITRGPNDCSDVSVASAGDTFLVAWVEQRGAVAEVHAARVGKDLVRIGEARTIADAGGDASQVRLVTNAQEAMLVWSEVRAGTDQSGIFGVRLAPSTLAPRGDVIRLYPALHAQSLRLAPAGDGWLLGWIEGAPPGVLAHQLAIAQLGATRPRDPRRFELDAAVTSFALNCEVTCRFVAAGTNGTAVDIYAWRRETVSGEWSVPRVIGAVAGTSGEDMSPVLLRDWLFFAEDDLHGKGRIAKSRLFWP